MPLFAALAKETRALLAQHLDELELPAGRALVTEGEANHTFFVLREGEAEVSVAGTPRRTLGPGDFFGEISMDRQVPATATVITRTPVCAYVMSRAQFRAVKANEPLLLQLRTVIAERLLADRSRS